MRERRKITNLVLTLAAVGLGFFAQSRFRMDPIRDALILYAVAIAIFGYVLRRERETLAEPSPVPPTRFTLADDRWVTLLLSGSGISIFCSLYYFRQKTHPIPETPIPFYLCWFGRLRSVTLAVYVLDDDGFDGDQPGA